MVKIYFCGSIRGGRQLALTYAKIIEMIQQHGKVLTEHLGDDAEIQNKDRVLSDRTIHDRDMEWIIESDLLVADVTVPSLGVGYEIGRAVEMNKPILCLFNTESKHTLSAMIAGIDGLQVLYYKDPGELEGALKQFIAQHAAHRTS
jgi:nucleoside 2-deoxyribosyltransferase